MNERICVWKISLQGENETISFYAIKDPLASCYTSNIYFDREFARVSPTLECYFFFRDKV